MKKILDLAAAEIADSSQTPFKLTSADFAGNALPVISVKGLGAGETVSLWIAAGDDWAQVTDSSGTQITFTNTQPAYAFVGVGSFGVTKTASTSALEVWLHTGR